MKDYFKNDTLDRDTLIQDTDFVNDASAFLQARTGRKYDNRDDLFDAFVEHMRFGNVNELTALRDANFVRKADEEMKDTTGRLFLTFDRLEKPTGVGQLIGDYAEGFLRAPSTIATVVPGAGWLGKGAAVATARTAAQTARLLATAGLTRQAGQTAAKQAGQAAAPSAARFAAQAAAKRGALDAIAGAGHGYGYSQARKRTEREEYENRNVLMDTAIGAALGAVPGVGIGGFKGLRAFKQEKRAVDELFTPSESAKQNRIDEGQKAAQQLFSKENVEANTLREALGDKFKPITEAALSKEMVEGGRALRQSQFEDYRFVLKPEVLENLEAATVELLQKLGSDASNLMTKGPDGKPQVKRISQIIAESLTRTSELTDNTSVDTAGIARLGTERIQDIVELQKKYGLTDQEFGYMFASEVSDAGRTLAFAGRVKKQMQNFINQVVKETDMLQSAGLLSKEVAEETIDAAQVANRSKLGTFFRNLDKTRLGMMTFQLATTMRNVIGGGLRMTTYLTDNFFQGALEGDLRRMGSGFRAWKTLAWDQSEGNILRLLFHDEMPQTFRRLYIQNADVQAELGIGSGMSKFARKLNVMNTYADNAFKRAIFMAELDTQLGDASAGYIKALKEQQKTLRALSPQELAALSPAERASRDAILRETTSGLDVRLRVGGHLRELIRTGRFSEIADTDKYGDALERAIKEATSTVYQRTYKEKLIDPKTGQPIQYNGIANAVLKFTSTPLTTWALPFPKFIMNSLEFMATHAPLIGMVGKRPTTEKIAKQMTGSALLYGAIQLRAAQGPEARWWELYDEDTKKHTNAVALYGPFAPLMLAADVILRSNINKIGEKYLWAVPIIAGSKEYQQKMEERWSQVAKDPLGLQSLFRDNMGREYLKALFGSTFRTGIGYEMAEKLYSDVETAYLEGKETGFEASLPAVSKAVAEFGGQWTNTFFVGGGMLRDVYATVDPQFEKIRDNDVGTNPLDIYIINSLKSLPLSDSGKYFGLIQGPEGVETVATSPFRQEELRREGRDVTQFTGLGTTEERSLLERELTRLEIPRYQAYRRFKSPTLNRKANVLYQEYIRDRLEPLLNTEAYRNQPDTDLGARRQRTMLRRELRRMTTQVTDLLLNKTRQSYYATANTAEEYEPLQKEYIFLLRTKLDGYGDDAKRFAGDRFETTYGRKPTLEGTQGVDDIMALIAFARAQ